MRTKAALFKVFVLALVLGALSASCSEDREVPVAPSTRIIRYSADVSEAPLTRATSVDYQYRFEVGDKLYVVNTGTDAGKLYGYLTLVSGAGQATAHFEGDLYCEDEFEPLSSTPVAVTLVGPSDRIHLLADPSDEGEKGKIYGTVYPDDEYASTFAEAVEKFSHFTCSSTFGATSFTLSQNSSFVICKIKMPAADLPVTSVTASLESGGNTVWEGTVTSTVNGADGKLDFIIPFEGGSVTLSSASISFEWTDALNLPKSRIFALTSSATLAANNYYTIYKSFPFDGFRIKGTVDNTTITFNYNYANDGIEYSFDDGLSWTGYTVPFTLNNNQEVCVQGNRINYKNVPAKEDDYGTPGSKPIFTATEKVYISGNIMSLLANKDILVPSAFHGAFSKGSSMPVDYIDIDPNADLILPATTLPTSCYQQMFRNCTSLTKTPTFRAESVAYRCCYNMFRECSILEITSGIKLSATTLATDCYRELFRKCYELDSIAQDFLPATMLADNCYQQMFQDTKIVTAPELPAEKLVKSCYSEMFRGCSALESVTCLATSISASGCLSNWMNGVKSGGTFTRPSSMNGKWPSGNSGIPSSWIQVDY